MELYYNPERMSETELKETFVAHQWLVDEIISILRGQPKGAGVQHIVIIAPRGMGKTTMLLMLRYAVLDSDIAAKWQPVLFPEESYGVYDLADLWLEVINHIAAETGDVTLHDQAIELRDEQSHGSDLQEAALAKIKDWRVKNKKRLMLLVDNFDMILAQIGDERDNARLRDVLMNDDALMLVGGATTFFKEARAYDQPLYNLFKIYNLNALDSAQIQELLRRRARIDGVENFDETLLANATRLQVLEYFTGGNPRLVLMLYRVITHSHISEVTRGLEKLLDEVTPYYKAKIESLPPQQRKILDHIARITGRTREGLTPTEIAAATRLAVNHVSAQLKRLTDVGYVRAANVRGRSSYYTLSEPLYAIWHQMRFGRDARRRMNWLVAFLKGWYDSEQISTECQRLQDLFRGFMSTGRVSEARDALEHRRYLVEAIDDKAAQTRTIEGIILCYLELKDVDTLKREVLADINVEFLTKETWKRLVEAGLVGENQLEPRGEGHVGLDARRAESAASLELARAAASKGQHDEALARFRLAVEMDPSSVAAAMGLASSLAATGHSEESVEVLTEMELDLAPDSAELYLLRGAKALFSSNPAEAITNLDQMLQRAPAVKETWFLKGLALTMLSRKEEALESFMRGLQLSPSSDGWLWHGRTLQGLGRDEEALTSFAQALEISPDLYDAHFYKSLILYRMDRIDELQRSIDTMLELDPNSADAYFLRAAVLLSTDLKDAMVNRDAMVNLKHAFELTSSSHRNFVEMLEIRILKFMLSVFTGELKEAASDWNAVLHSSDKETKEKSWPEAASQALRLAAELGHWTLVRDLIRSSDLEESLFPLARALDYLLTEDNALIEKLSPEVRGIVEEIVTTLQKSSPANRPTGQRRRIAKRSVANAMPRKRPKPIT